MPWLRNVPARGPYTWRKNEVGEVYLKLSPGVYLHTKQKHGTNVRQARSLTPGSAHVKCSNPSINPLQAVTRER